MTTSLIQSQIPSIQGIPNNPMQLAASERRESLIPRIINSPQYMTTPRQLALQQTRQGSIVQQSNNPMQLAASERRIQKESNMTQGVNVAISSKLTIYSQSGHIIQKFPQGTKVITLPKSVEIASIVIIDSNGGIVPFSYVPEANMGIALTDRSTGEKVEAAVIKEGEVINGKILSLGSDNVTLMTGNQITNIREYDRVIVGINEDVTRPRIVVGRDTMAFTVSYLLSSIAWTCIGTGLIDNNKNIMYLRLAGNISNNTETDINAQTILVSGEVYQYRARQAIYAQNESYTPSALMARSAAPMSSQKAQSSMLEDYVKYEVGNRLIHNQDIAELGTWQIPIIKLYVHQTNDDNIVRFGYRFTAPGYIPSSSLNIYSIDSNKDIDAYLGSNEIEESQKTDEVDIMLGESTMLQCKSLVVISNDITVEDEDTMRKYKLPMNESSFNGNVNFNQQTMKADNYVNERRWHIITEDLQVDITNHNDRPVSLVLKHFVSDKFLVETRCQTYKNRKNGFIEWYFDVPPRTSAEPRKEKFTCQILTASYY